MYTTGGKLKRSKSASPSTDHYFNDYLADWFRFEANGQHLDVSGVPDIFTRCTNAVARTNPSRPYVDVPASVLDIRTRIGQIKEDFDDLLKRVPRRHRVYHRGYRALEHGEAWLQYKFMIAPLVGDIVKMTNAVEQIHRRIGELNRLYDGKGLRRTVNHGSWSERILIPSVPIQSAYQVCNIPYRAETFVNCRTHVRWAPESRVGLKPPSDVLRAWARRAVMGATIDLSTLWELTPWSWLADWFGNVGEFYKANRNIIPARLIGVYPMKHTRTEYFFPAWSWTSKGRLTTFTGASRFRESKTRSIGAVTLVAHFPLLESSQVGILAALAASGNRRRY